MTLGKLCEICEKHKIPKNARLLSNSGWEGGETDMDGVFFSREENTIVFTQGYDCELEQQYYTEGWIRIDCTTENETI